MNETENKFEAAGDIMNDGLLDEVHSLRMLLSASLIIVIMFTLCVDVFLIKQVSLLNGETAVTKQQTEQMFPTAKASDLWNKLNDFSKTHPDFETVIAKYRPVINQFTSGNPAAAAK
jgi:hypothetical protein